MSCAQTRLHQRSSPPINSQKDSRRSWGHFPRLLDRSFCDLCNDVKLFQCAGETTPPPRSSLTIPAQKSLTPLQESRHKAGHVLLLLTWLLPLAALVLAVWVHTLATAGLIAINSIYMGDHNFLSITPYLILVDFASSSWPRDSLLLLWNR
jgi:hypothetical protein